MDKQDITMYGYGELSNIVLNDEYLCNIIVRAARKGDFEIIKGVIEDSFIFDKAQLEDLEETFEAEIIEGI